MIANPKAHPGMYTDNDITQTCTAHRLVAILEEFNTDDTIVVCDFNDTTFETCHIFEDCNIVMNDYDL